MRSILNKTSLLFILVLLCGLGLKAQQPILYLKTNANAPWKAFDKGIPTEATVSGIAQLGSTLFVTTDFHGIYRKGITQVTWQKIGMSLPHDIDINAIEVFGNRLLIATYRKGIWYSNDKGNKWFSSQIKFSKTPVRALIYRGNELLVGTDSGVFHSRDGGVTWQHLASEKQVLGFARSGNNIYVGLQDGAALLTEKNDWKYIYEGDALHDIAFENGSIYAMTLGKGLQRSQSMGVTWQKVQSNMGPDNLYTFEIAKQGNSLYAAQWNGVFTSSDNGFSWIQENGLPMSLSFGVIKNTELGLLAAVAMR